MRVNCIIILVSPPNMQNQASFAHSSWYSFSTVILFFLFDPDPQAMGKFLAIFLAQCMCSQYLFSLSMKPLMVLAYKVLISTFLFKYAQRFLSFCEIY